MRVYCLRTLREFWDIHPDAKQPLRAWFKIAGAADWASIQDVRSTYPHADAKTLKSKALVTIFNIGGNKYRLIASIVYAYRSVYVKKILTHPDYSQGNWENQI